MLDKPYLMQPERDNAQTRAAIRILHHLDQTLLPTLIEPYSHIYHRARHAYGTPATTTRARPFRGAPAIEYGTPMTVSGVEDEAHGHTRLRAIIDQVVRSLYINQIGPLDLDYLIDLRERCRGDFPDLYHHLDAMIKGMLIQRRPRP